MSQTTLDHHPSDPGPKRLVARIGVPLTLVALLAGAAYWLYVSLGNAPASPRRQTVKIAVLPDTPPPPPPPKEEKKPEPVKQEVAPQPMPTPPRPMDTPPEPQQLKMDGPAGEGPSAFAAGAVSQEYQGGAVGSGSGGGANRMQFAFFTNRLTRHIQTELARRPELKGSDYRVNVRVWLQPDGHVQRIELASTSGNPETDRLLQETLTRLQGIDQVPPSLPQPLSLRITNRVTG